MKINVTSLLHVMHKYVGYYCAPNMQARAADEKTQSSEPLHAKMNPTSCLLGSRFAYNPVFLLAGTLLFDKKIC